MALVIDNANTKLSKTGLADITVGDNLTFADNFVKKPRLQSYAVATDTPTIIAGTVSLNLDNANAFQVSLTANVTSISLQNVPASGRLVEIAVQFTQDATGGRTVAWPTSFKWQGGMAPTVSSTANARDILFALTVDGGATWNCSLAKDFR
ncbi:hypothetical protein Sp245p_28975 (plasmid) [Azospirillum baldaniorum]|uniref:Uncharacterized protein n=1 Tax=Azospirillum baldaniorum TaxID=1064539 RepID=A0A9P1NQH9_9PROT|nr:hypothetical protein [Azospirillum baldaniorum]AWJ93855.1 hypothetical protein Sp245p_28975 [Azospirillum baldaniorum]TWA81680.1 hypothetical protein FBZ85_10254 [Azospirillum brasilense]CCD02016.1 protein of unknown function [Azospirillum baldaniorum]